MNLLPAPSALIDPDFPGYLVGLSGAAFDPCQVRDEGNGKTPSYLRGSSEGEEFERQVNEDPSQMYGREQRHRDQEPNDNPQSSSHDPEDAQPVFSKVSHATNYITVFVA